MRRSEETIEHYFSKHDLLQWALGKNVKYLAHSTPSRSEVITNYKNSVQVLGLFCKCWAMLWAQMPYWVAEGLAVWNTLWRGCWNTRCHFPARADAEDGYGNASCVKRTIQLSETSLLLDIILKILMMLYMPRKPICFSIPLNHRHFSSIHSAYTYVYSTLSGWRAKIRGLLDYPIAEEKLGISRETELL